MKWLAKRVRQERRALERARRRFVRRPSDERLHDVRTTGRRFRSLLEDISDCMPRAKLLDRVKRAAAATDAARDATVIAQLLESRVDPGERAVALALAQELHDRERCALQQARNALRRMRFTRS
jgi:CHAD domain-containing protein